MVDSARQYDLGQDGALTARRLGGRVFFERASVEHLVANGPLRRGKRRPLPIGGEGAADDAIRGYQAARGVLPWRPGDELPEDAIRRLRDGEAGRDACDPSARATLARLDAIEDKIRARMTPAEYDEFCRARAEVFDSLEEWERNQEAARLRTLYADDTGAVVEGAADFEGDR